MIRFRELRPRLVPSWLGLQFSRTLRIELQLSGIRMEKQKEGRLYPEKTIPIPVSIRHSEAQSFRESSIEVHLTFRKSERLFRFKFVRGDGGQEAAVIAEDAPTLTSTSIFPSLAAAADFFSLGVRPVTRATNELGHYHGMELRSLDWRISPFACCQSGVLLLLQTWSHFPKAPWNLNCALIMRKIDHEWHSRPDLYLSANKQFLTEHP